MGTRKAMADDINPTAIVPVSPSNSGGRQGGDSARRRFFPPPPVKRTVRDVATALGGSDGTLSSAVEQSIAALVEEIERLRHEIDLSHHYENFLGEEADRHSILPVLNRRALLRELGQLLIASESAGVSGSLLYLHVGEVERLHMLYGLAVSDAALLHVAQIIRAECRQTDLIGYLDGGDFAIALAVAEPAAAEEKARALVAHLGEQPMIWRETPIVFPISFGLVHFHKELSAEDVLNMADAAWRNIAPSAGVSAD